MSLGYVAAVHEYEEGGAPFYTLYLEGLGEKQIEGHHLSPVVDQEEQPPPLCPSQCHPTLFPGHFKPKKTNRPRRST
jgi:hypothetical protein